MCGIWFSIGHQVERSVIDIISYRGPDGVGWVEKECTLGPVKIGHRRLSILDLSDAGAQPMCDESARFWLTFNGEIYNHLELRPELEAKGVRFQGHSDSETLLHAYIHWGKKCLERFNGMFAFVIWDQKDQKLFAARDRFGVKPLYFSSWGKGLAIASEQKQILALPGFKTRLDQKGLSEFVQKFTPSPKRETLFQEVENLPPGHWLCLDVAKNSLQLQKWYDLHDRIKNMSVPQPDEIAELFGDAVKKRLLSDVPVGALLSGGMDSSAIVSVVSRRCGYKDLQTFTSWAPDKSVDEREYSRAVAQFCEVKNTEVEITQGGFEEDLKALIWHQEVPQRGTSVFAQWNVFKNIRGATDIKIVLDGQGADETFVGYYSMLYPWLSEYLRHGRFAQAFKEAKKIANRHSDISLFDILRDAAQIQYPGLIQTLYQIKNRGRKLSQAGLLNEANEKERLNRLSSANSFEDYQIALMQNSIYHMLHWQDRNAMANSLETRHPFLDYRLVEAVIKVGYEQKLKDGRTKILLREFMKGELPENVRLRDNKFGFPGPTKKIFSGEMKKDVLNACEQVRDVFTPYINLERFDQMRKDFDQKELYSTDLSAFFMFHKWLDVFSVEQS